MRFHRVICYWRFQNDDSHGLRTGEATEIRVHDRDFFFAKKFRISIEKDGSTTLTVLLDEFLTVRCTRVDQRDSVKRPLR